MFAKKLKGTTLICAFLLACSPSEPPPRQSWSVESVLGNAAGDEGFARALAPRRFHFPEDHGAHPAFRSEWWYLTGNLEAQTGRRFGFQVTLFRQGFNRAAGDRPSKWAVENIWMGHAAVTDVKNKTHRGRERFSRGGPGMAGAQLQPFKVWLDDWVLRADTAAAFPWRLDVGVDDFALALRLTAMKPIVLHGDRGLSQKSEAAGNASYYYSLTRLKTQGQVRLGAETFTVTGLSWLDREWSTSALDSQQTGWDWFSLQLHSGEELMYYRLRKKGGGVHPSSSGTWVGVDGSTLSLEAEEVELTPLQWWENDAGERYPVRWRLRLKAGQGDWIVEALVEDQEMDLSFSYWEGAVVVLDAHSGQVRGRGYLEMTGYEPAAWR
ncbi:MAG: lipocalin-like domain-containing protein [Exilibacterium sp.]